MAFAQKEEQNWLGAVEGSVTVGALQFLKNYTLSYFITGYLKFHFAKNAKVLQQNVTLDWLLEILIQQILQSITNLASLFPKKFSLY